VPSNPFPHVIAYSDKLLFYNDIGILKSEKGTMVEQIWRKSFGFERRVIFRNREKKKQLKINQSADILEIYKKI